MLLFFWGSLALYGARRPERRLATRLALSLGLALSMLGQERLLYCDGLLTLQTGLPLHLCGMTALLSLPTLWGKTDWFLPFSLLLGAPCALLALCFPAVAECSRPFWMALHFCRLHALIVCAALFRLAETGKPPTLREARRAFLLACGFLWAVQLLNEGLRANYWFLSAVPSGTPLQWLASRGRGFYLCSLHLLAMLCFRLAADAWRSPRLWRVIAGNRKACSLCKCPCNRCSSPCTTPSRGSSP